MYSSVAEHVYHDSDDSHCVWVALKAVVTFKTLYDDICAANIFTACNCVRVQLIAEIMKLFNLVSVQRVSEPPGCKYRYQEVQ